jgi:hypothetical protein
MTTALASESPAEVSQKKTATVRTRPPQRAQRWQRPDSVTIVLATPAEVTQETMATAHIKLPLRAPRRVQRR